MSPTQLFRLALPPVIMVALCAATARAIGGDPMLGAELGLAAVVGVWMTLFAIRIRSAIAAQRQLEQVAMPIRVGRRDVRLLAMRRTPEAFVAGPFQPAIFVSPALIDKLDVEEMEAVLLHEEHHRRTRAPLRGLALASWSRLMGRVPVVRSWIERRLAHLEVEADQYALSAGASSAALASALIKCDRSPSPLGVGYASAGDLRLRRLLDAGEAADGPAGTPIEWLAPAVLAFALGACHFFLG
ncbi:MAG: M48 family metalloprotease [Candidatus Limnocylindria bacterium]